MCNPRFCYDNPNSPYCKCIVDPYSVDCSCLNDPNSCSRKEFMESIVEYDMKIRDACNQNKLYYTVNPFLIVNDRNLNNTNYVVYDNTNEVSIIDPTVIFNMYYPPCKYNPDNPNSKRGNRGNSTSSSGRNGDNGGGDDTEPCIPFPDQEHPPI